MNVEQLRQAREESANVAYLDFIKHIKEDKNGLYCFFEGKDSPYYRPRIIAIYNGNYYPIRCSGKEKVLKVYQLIKNHQEYNKYKKLFFIDRDFDEPNLNDEIYETPCYSIENFYTNTITFGEILKNEIGISEASIEFTQCLNIYSKLRDDYHEAATLFNAWYACLKEIRNQTKEQIGIKLKSSIPSDFISISIKGIESDYDLVSIKAKYPEAIEIEENHLGSKIDSFNSKDKSTIFRGKFELDFMLNILQELIDDSKKTKTYITRPIKFNIDRSQAISLFSQYAHTPSCLTEYINRRSA